MRSRTGQTAGRLCLVVVVVIAGCGTVALAQPSTVFVYDRNPGDGFEDGAEAYIWSQLGLLDANGKPIDVPEAQKIRDTNNNVVGYRSANGAQEAYNVSSSATTAQAWQRVAQNGTLQIIKHGAEYKDANGVEHTGGGMILDGGQPYDGFGSGTGVGYQRKDKTSGPYNLPARPGANITLIANGCYTSHDPDDTGAQTAVTDSAGIVPGVAANPQGHNGCVYPHCGSSEQGGTVQQRTTAREALLGAARAAGFPTKPDSGAPRPPTTDQDIADWISSLPFSIRYDTVQSLIDAAVPPAGTVTERLTYGMSENKPAATGNGGYHQVPTQVYAGVTALVPFLYDESYVAAVIQVNPNSLRSPALFHIDMWGQLPASPPSGRTLASGIFNFQAINGNAIQSFVGLAFTFNVPASQVQVLWFNPNALTWMSPQGLVTLDPANGIAYVQTGTMGVYAAFAGRGVTVPAISNWGLVVMTVILLGAGVVILRRRKPLGLGQGIIFCW